MKSSLKICLVAIVFSVFICGTVFAQPDYDYLIIIYNNARTLLLYEADNEQEVLAAYLIGVPRGRYYKIPMCGKVKSVQFNPSWTPTENIQNEHIDLEGVALPETIEPGDPRNAMGLCKINLLLEGTVQPIKIHGTNKPRSIGKRVTHGCIRMTNEDVLELAKIIQYKKTQVIFEN